MFIQGTRTLLGLTIGLDGGRFQIHFNSYPTPIQYHHWNISLHSTIWQILAIHWHTSCQPTAMQIDKCVSSTKSNRHSHKHWFQWRMIWQTKTIHQPITILPARCQSDTNPIPTPVNASGQCVHTQGTIYLLGPTIGLVGAWFGKQNESHCQRQPTQSNKHNPSLFLLPNVNLLFPMPIRQSSTNMPIQCQLTANTSGLSVLIQGTRTLLGLTISLDGGWFHSDPNHRSSSILDNICHLSK